MKQHNRKDKLECKHGGKTKSGKHLNCRKIVDRANKKTVHRSVKRFLDVLLGV